MHEKGLFCVAEWLNGRWHGINENVATATICNFTFMHKMKQNHGIAAGRKPREFYYIGK